MAQTQEEVRQGILDRQAKADEDIHDLERQMDDDARLGDQKAYAFHESQMKDAEERFEHSSRELDAFNKDPQGFTDYANQRQEILDKQSAAEKDLQGYNERFEEDARVGDENASQYEWNQAQNASDRFDNASQDLQNLDNDYWGSNSAGEEAERTGEANNANVEAQTKAETDASSEASAECDNSL